MAASGQRTADAAQRELDLLKTQAEAAQRQSELAEAALNASIRPLFTDVPPNTLQEVRQQRVFDLMQASRQGQLPDTRKIDISKVWSDIDSESLSTELVVPIRNVGSGVGLIVDVAAFVPRDEIRLNFDDHSSYERVIGWPGGPTLPVGEHTTLMFREPKGSAAWAGLHSAISRGADVDVEVVYQDVSGAQDSVTRLSLSREDGTERYRVVMARARFASEGN
jgi:hypothetical protein